MYTVVYMLNGVIQIRKFDNADTAYDFLFYNPHLECVLFDNDGHIEEVS